MTGARRDRRCDGGLVGRRVWRGRSAVRLQNLDVYGLKCNLTARDRFPRRVGPPSYKPAVRTRRSRRAGPARRSSATAARGASLRRPVRYPSDDLTPAERERLAPHVTNLDGPVFALVNLPETVKGALFARYSRYPGTLRRLFLDEFADSLPEGGAWDGREGERAAQLYERIFVGYGDDSVAQLGGAHVACEWVSNVLTKVLQRPRLGGLPRAVDALHRLRRADARRRLPLLPRRRARPGVRARRWTGCSPPTPPRSRACALGRRDASRARRASPRRRGARAIGAKALDLLRGLLPAASLSHMGIYATGQTYEQLILHLIAHPLPEARRYGELILARGQGGHAELRRARRAARPRRRVGGLPGRAPGRRRALGRRGSACRTRDPDDARPSVSLVHVDGDEDALLAALLFEAAGTERGAHARRRRGALRRRARRRSCATSSASARTAATGRAAASRRCATASRSCRTTARSATSSATAC